MWEHIPLEIQVEIIKRISVKSLIQFRSVSKAWKNLIDSKEFITGHSLRHTHSQRLIVLNFDCCRNFLAILDDQTSFHRFVPTIPLTVERFTSLKIVGSSQGLLCMRGFYHFPNSVFANYKVVIWNPSIRKAVVPNVSFDPCANFIGFGVSPDTCDPTIVEISHNENRAVRVFKLSTGAWINLSDNLPKQVYNIFFEQSVYNITLSQASVDKFIYWLGYKRITETETTNCNLILSFDVTNDKFEVVDLPEVLALKVYLSELQLSKLRESLIVLEYSMKKHICNVWVMETGSQKFFKKLYTIRKPNAAIKILGFNSFHNPILEMHEGEDPEDAILEAALAVYDPTSEHIDDLGIWTDDYFYVSTYRESLLLLDQQDLEN